jgi:hypothetical protein
VALLVVTGTAVVEVLEGLFMHPLYLIHLTQLLLSVLVAVFLNTIRGEVLLVGTLLVQE